jgi:hypothetical protein
MARLGVAIVREHERGVVFRVGVDPLRSIVEKRAKITAAEGGALGVGKLAEAAGVIDAHPIALQLRSLQVLAEIAIERNSTMVFPSQFLDRLRAVSQFRQSERHAQLRAGRSGPRQPGA